MPLFSPNYAHLLTSKSAKSLILGKVCVVSNQKNSFIGVLNFMSLNLNEKDLLIFGQNWKNSTIVHQSVVHSSESNAGFRVLVLLLYSSSWKELRQQQFPNNG